VRKQREGDYDIVTGTRYAKGGSVYGWDFRRRLTRFDTLMCTLSH
jgi:dolichol-phosphate mannosyltransferase